MSEGEAYIRHGRLRGTVLIVGTGSVGSLVAAELSRRGISPLCLVDQDVLEVENLVRHHLGAESLGQPKAPALADRIRRDFPPCDTTGLHANFLELPQDEQFRLVREADVVIAATDSVECQRRVNEVCLAAEVMAVYPGIWVDPRVRDAEVGEIIWVLPGRHTPCYLCATEWRQAGADAEARGGTRADIQVLVAATVSVVAGLLDPHAERAQILDEQRTYILVHAFMPTSREVRRLLPGGLRTFRVPFPETPCPACGGQEPTSAQPPDPGGQITEETAQALVRALDTTVARLGELDTRLANLEGLASQVAGQSIGPELVRVAAELGEVRERLPALQGIDPALAGLVKLSEELGKVVPSVELVERFGALLRAMITEMRPYQVEIQAAAEKLPQINSPQTWETFKRLEAVARFLERVAAQWGYTDIEPGSGR